MTVKQKARQLALTLVGGDQNPQPLIEVLMGMAAWQSEQMMRVAVSAKVTGAGSKEGSILLAAEFPAGNVPACRYGDKMKIIIIKED